MLQVNSNRFTHARAVFNAKARHTLLHPDRLLRIAPPTSPVSPRARTGVSHAPAYHVLSQQAPGSGRACTVA